jgi:hypothetical protein
MYTQQSYEIGAISQSREIAAAKELLIREARRMQEEPVARKARRFRMPVPSFALKVRRQPA